jgi:hypothetical protein
MPVVDRSVSSTTPSAVDSLFDTRPAPTPTRPVPATLSATMKATLMLRIQEERVGRNGYPPANLNGAKVDALRAAIASGDAVEVKINQNVSVVLKKADDLEKSTSFFYKTTAGFAGTQFFGPFNV